MYAVDVGGIHPQHGNHVVVVAVAEQAETGLSPDGGGVVLVQHQGDFGTGVAGADRNAQQSKRFRNFALDVLVLVPDALVVAGVAGGRVGAGGGVGEHEAAARRGSRVFLDHVLADTARNHVGLQVGSAYVHDSHLPLVLEHQSVHLFEKLGEGLVPLGELDDV